MPGDHAHGGHRIFTGVIGPSWSVMDVVSVVGWSVDIGLGMTPACLGFLELLSVVLLLSGQVLEWCCCLVYHSTTVCHHLLLYLGCAFCLVYSTTVCHHLLLYLGWWGEENVVT